MRKIIIISDLFKKDYESANQPIGGAELNDDVLFSHLESKGIVKCKIHSNEFDCYEMINFIKSNKDCVYLISNFANLHFRVSAYLLDNCKYFIYEHDYKFHKYRNPINFNKFIAPKNQIINFNFFKNAKKVICLSKLHYDIFYENLGLTNLHNTTCSLWSQEILDYIEELSTTTKNEKIAIVDSDNPIKRKNECVKYCIENDLEFDLIKSSNYKEFLKKLSEYRAVVLLPGHPEPTPRVAVEAKMLNCKIYSNPLSLGVAYEKWFALNGGDLIKEVKKIRDTALEYITGELTNEI